MDTDAWARLCAWQLQHQPHCCSCQRAGRAEAATVVVHAEAPGDDLGRFWDPGNLLSLCDGCHADLDPED